MERPVSSWQGSLLTGFYLLCGSKGSAVALTSPPPLPSPWAGDDESGRSKQSRSEKKSRKAMQKLGMKPVPGIARVQIKKSKNVSLLV